MSSLYVDIPKGSHFPIENLPYGVFSSTDTTGLRIGVAIGDMVLDLTALEGLGEFSSIVDGKIFQSGTLNTFIAEGRSVWNAVRQQVWEILTSQKSVLASEDNLLFQQDNVAMHLPVKIGDYTDFYSSREHAVNVGTMFRGKDNALNPNWLHLPVAYHGRASSIVVSGTDIKCPYGQIKPDDSDPIYGQSKSFDFELEMGAIIGKNNKLGTQVSTEDAIDHVFGMVLVNDWSARDIQKWEYVPLGPFLGKNFATSISPWVVTMDALEPFRTKAPIQSPEPLEYLKRYNNSAYDIHLDVLIQTNELTSPETIAQSNYKYLYWDLAQQIAHHTVGGCNMQVGDLVASGTISGPDQGSMGSMLELAWKGTRPIKLSSGETRSFLQKNDTLIIEGYCKRNDLSLGFGSVVGKIL
tara:strand:- start:766 stop:1995 length:1230 start_codon:yes stop_codon:yes gene_type:complete